MDNGARSYRRFLDGDENAFVEIMDEYRDGLIFFINGYLNDFHAAEDIAADCFVFLLVHKHRYNFKVSLKTYLYMIGRSKSLNYLKRRKIITTEALDEAENEVSDEKTPEDAVLTSERKRAVHEALKNLNEEMRTAVHLVYFDGMSYGNGKNYEKIPQTGRQSFIQGKSGTPLPARKGGRKPLMKTREEFNEEVFARRDAYIKERKQRTKWKIKFKKERASHWSL